MFLFGTPGSRYWPSNHHGSVEKLHTLEDYFRKYKYFPSETAVLCRFRWEFCDKSGDKPFRTSLTDPYSSWVIHLPIHFPHGSNLSVCPRWRHVRLQRWPCAKLHTGEVARDPKEPKGKECHQSMTRLDQSRDPLHGEVLNIPQNRHILFFFFLLTYYRSSTWFQWWMSFSFFKAVSTANIGLFIRRHQVCPGASPEPFTSSQDAGSQESTRTHPESPEADKPWNWGVHEIDSHRGSMDMNDS